MINGLFDSSTIPVMEQVVNFTQARQNVLASNIANMDTPGYRTRELSPEVFQTKLKEAIESRNTTNDSISQSQLHRDDNDEMKEVRESIKSILFHDDSDIGLEQQVAEVTKNLAKHNMAIALLRSQFETLRAAISERP